MVENNGECWGRNRKALPIVSLFYGDFREHRIIHLHNSQDKDCTEKTLHLTWAGEFHALSFSCANSGRWEKTIRHMIFQMIEWPQVKNLHFSFFFCIIELMWAFVHTFPVPFWVLKVKSTRFPLEESVWGEQLVTESLHLEEFRSERGFPSSWAW